MCCMPWCTKSRVLKGPREWQILQHKDCLVSMWWLTNLSCPFKYGPLSMKRIIEGDSCSAKATELFVKQLCLPNPKASSLHAQDNAKGIDWSKIITKKSEAVCLLISLSIHLGVVTVFWDHNCHLQRAHKALCQVPCQMLFMRSLGTPCNKLGSDVTRAGILAPPSPLNRLYTLYTLKLFSLVKGGK